MAVKERIGKKEDEMWDMEDQEESTVKMYKKEHAGKWETQQ